MPNVENIKPYADFAHKAAQHGGVDCYLNELETSSYDKGVADTEEDILKKLPYIFFGGIICWEGGKAIVKKAKNYFSNRKLRDVQRVEKAKNAIKTGVLELESANFGIEGKCENDEENT